MTCPSHIRAALVTGRRNSRLKGALAAKRKLEDQSNLQDADQWTLLQALQLFCVLQDEVGVNHLTYHAFGFRSVIRFSLGDVSGDDLALAVSIENGKLTFTFPPIIFDHIGTALIARWLSLRDLFKSIVSINTDFAQIPVNLGDGSTENGIGFCDNKAGSTLIPDCDYMESKGYNKQKDYYAKHHVPWKSRRDLCLWRGSSTGHYDENIFTLPRVALCLIAQRYPDHGFDVGLTSIIQASSAEEDAIRRAGLTAEFVPWQDFANYKYHVDIDGNSNAWQGLYLKLLSGGLVLKVESPFGFRQWYYDRLKPWMNYVPVSSDMGEIADVLGFLRRNDSLAERIAEGGRSLALSLTYDQEIASAAAVFMAAVARQRFLSER